jgi:hypothetical protein
MVAVATMKAAAIIFAGSAALIPVRAQLASVSLPELLVNSPRVANQSPAAMFATPISALRYEPRVDVQARNLTEAQADVTIRGGIFENTGFRVGGSTLVDPQTGHYFAELPIAPSMLGAPDILTGAANAAGTTNATTGTVAFGWRPIRTGGAVSATAGEFATHHEELSLGQLSDLRVFGARLGADVAVAHAESDGSMAFGDSTFDRANARVQLASGTAQTDVIVGYQKKFFGWPNLYTPFNSPETENIETTLFAFNHRADLGHGDWFQFAAYHRRNKDDYAFSRLAPLGPIHPFQHTSWVTGTALDGRKTVGDLSLMWRGEILADRITSTSLTFGPYRDRTLTKLALVPEKAIGAATLRAGATYDHCDRDGSSVSPLVEWSLQEGARRWHASYVRVTQVATYTALKSSPAGGLFRGNQNLGRESSHQAEVGVADTRDGWNVEATAFWRRDDSLVDWTFRRGVTARNANPVDIDTAGFEAVARHSWSACDLVLGYTLLGKTADYRGALVDASFYALNYARQRFTAALTWRIGHGFELRMDNTARVQAGNFLRVIGGDRAVTSSLGLTYRPRAWRGAALTVQADNLWNSSFQEVPATPASRRTITGGVSYAW